jgi:predicted heme/steroid binding protein
MKRHTTISGLLNISVIGLALGAWLQATNGTSNLLSIASLLGVLAFGLMWVHYVADAIDPREACTTDMQYTVSRIVVLLAIVAHPLAVNAYLLQNGFGFPPASYDVLLDGKAWAVLLGWLAFIAFVLFEVRGKLARYKRHIMHVNALAMGLVIIHGLVAGLVLMPSWYRYVWWAMALVYGVVITRHYLSYYAGNAVRRGVALTTIAMLTIAGIASVLMQRQETARTNNEQQSVQLMQSVRQQPANKQVVATGITANQLAENNGIDGAKCWVAVDRTVYDASGNSEWENGSHKPSNGLARCGRDLTDVIGQSPHGRSVLGELDTVGSYAP